MRQFDISKLGFALVDKDVAAKSSVLAYAKDLSNAPT